MFFNISFLKFKHDPPERKKLALVLASYYMQKLEKSSFLSSARLNERIFKIKNTFSELFGKEVKKSKTKPAKTQEYNPNKFSIETLLNIINSQEEEQINFFEKIYKVKSANRLFDDFLENYFNDYSNQLSKLFINLAKNSDNPQLIQWLIKKLDMISSGQEELKFEVLDKCGTTEDPNVKNSIIEQLYNLAQYNLRKTILIILKLTKGMASRTIIFIAFLMKCKNQEPALTLKILAEVLKEEIPLSLKYNILEYVKENYYKNEKKADEILNYLSKEKDSRFIVELNRYLENLEKL